MAKVDVAPEPDAQKSKFNKLKLAFLYVLIGGLVISALISVSAILIGEFNSVIQKALLTTLVLVTHSLLALAIVSADSRNMLGKSIIATTILVSVLANMFTTTFGIWQIWGEGASLNAFHLYMLAIGTAFVIAGVFKLRLAHQATRILTYVSVGLIGLFSLLVVPWIVVDNSSLLDAFYFRAIAAAGILAATSLVITAIVNRIALGQHQALRHKKSDVQIPGAMLAIYINIGVLVAFFWLFGFFNLLIGASQNNTSDRNYYPYDEPILRD
jgi:hypothetical protein